MKLAVLSDLHLGAQNCALVRDGRRQPALDLLLEAAAERGPLDSLVILGDLFDLSLAPFDKAWEDARLFFQAVRPLATKIVYVPGNHDFSMWNYLEQDIAITNRIRTQGAPKGFRYSVPAVLDFTAGSAGTPRLSGIDPTPGSGYDGGYFQELWPRGEDREFLVAYPNLYLLEEGGTTLMTHGQYFDGFWNLLGDLCVEAASQELHLQIPGKPSVAETVQLNYFTSLLNSSAIGQAGIFADMARSLSADAQTGRTGRMEAMRPGIKRFVVAKLELHGLFGWIKAAAVRLLLDKALEKLIARIARPGSTRFNADYVTDHKAAIEAYLGMSFRELSGLRSRETAPSDMKRMLFGHTHLPTTAADPARPVAAPCGGSTACVNTGGWVLDEKDDFDAGVVRYDSSVPRWEMVNVSKAGVSVPFPV